MKEVMAEMEARSLQQVTSEDQLTGQTYMVDAHCHDLLHFPSDLLDMLEQHPLIEQCHLVLQVGRSLYLTRRVHTLCVSVDRELATEA